jgi:ABC-type transport system involved in cytochrome c biogenesis ATPase subunit
MLEVKLHTSYFDFYFTVFSGTAVFLKNFRITDYKDFCKLFLNSAHSKQTAIMKEPNFFNLRLSVLTNFALNKKFLNAEALPNIMLKYFELDKSILTKKLKDLTEEEKTIFAISHFFFEQKPIWILRINDLSLSNSSILKIETMLTSRIANSDGIIFYSSLSNKPLKIENQILLI